MTKIDELIALFSEEEEFAQSYLLTGDAREIIKDALEAKKVKQEQFMPRNSGDFID